MKNLVMQVKGKYAVVMNENGEFTKVKNSGYKTGQRFETKAGSGRAGVLKHIAMIAAVFVILLGAGSAYAYYTPFSEVSIDINPSVVMRMNFFNNVLDVTTMNEDAQALIDGIDLKNTDLETALKTLVKALKEQGYLSSDEQAEIMISTYSDNDMRAQNMLENVEKFLNREMEQQQVQANVEGEQIGLELRNRAREMGVSPGKLMLAERCAQALGDTSEAKIQELLGKTVKEVQAIIKEKKSDKASQKGVESDEDDIDDQTGETTQTPDTQGKGNSDKETKPKENSKGNTNNQGNGKKNTDNQGKGTKDQASTQTDSGYNVNDEDNKQQQADSVGYNNTAESAKYSEGTSGNGNQ